MSQPRVTWAPAPIGTGREPGYTGHRAFPGFSSCVSRRNRHRFQKDNIRGVTKASIRHMARRGGVRRMQAEIYDSTRVILRSYLEDIVQQVCHVVELCGRKTIKTTDILYVLKRRGRTLYGFDEAQVQHRSGMH